MLQPGQELTTHPLYLGQCAERLAARRQRADVNCWELISNARWASSIHWESRRNRLLSAIYEQGLVKSTEVNYRFHGMRVNEAPSIYIDDRGSIGTDANCSDSNRANTLDA